MEIVWLSLAVVLGILESVTYQFICIWFAGGALAALISQLLGASIYVQWIVFALTSAVLLIVTRPLVKRLTKKGAFRSNTDSLIGKTAVMTASTDSLGSGGEAKADGKIWTVKSAEGEPILKGSVVTVEKIEGVKLVVRK